jgi:hypothetical protein
VTDLVIRGKVSQFGGPDDVGVAADEGLALFELMDIRPMDTRLFLVDQPAGTTGLARRLDPQALYVACRWDYDQTSREWLRDCEATVINPKTQLQALARPVDWGPSADTGRAADLSPGLAAALGLETGDECVVTVPLP